MTRNQFRRPLECTYWIGMATVMVVVVGFVVGFAVGGTLLSVKYTLFVLGVLLFGVGSLLLQPSSPGERTRSTAGRLLKRLPSLSGSSGTQADDLTGAPRDRIGALVQRFPPFNRDPLPPDRRISRSLKVFVTGLVVLGISFAMEFVFGVTV